MSTPRNCGKCGSFFTTHDDNKVLCSKCIVKENNMDWKDLTKDTPIEVLINMDKYQIQFKPKGLAWIDTEIEDPIDLFQKIVSSMLKYRYRLRPLKSCRLTNTQWYEICHNDLTTNEERQNGIWGGRKVEIIGDDE